MTQTTLEAVHQRIRERGFEPFPCPAGKVPTNPGEIVPPENLNPEEWLSISQAEMISGASDSTVKRWQNDRQMVNFTFPLDGRSRESDRHFILKTDFVSYLEERRIEEASFIRPSDFSTGQLEPSVNQSLDGKLMNGRLNGRFQTDRQMAAFREVFSALQAESANKLLAVLGEAQESLKRRDSRIGWQILFAGALVALVGLAAVVGFLSTWGRGQQWQILQLRNDLSNENAERAKTHQSIEALEQTVQDFVDQVSQQIEGRENP